MQIASAAIGPEGGHAAGRALLKAMYEKTYGRPVPPIAVEERGKPYFTEGTVHFSISHTKTRVFCVLSEKRVGIDAEDFGRQISLKLAEKILSEKEKQQFRSAQDSRDALLRFWVLKEAAAKCTGLGLQGYPNHTDFSLHDPRVRLMDGCYVAVIEE